MVIASGGDEPTDPWMVELHRQVRAGEIQAEWAIAQVGLVYGPKWATPTPVEEQDPKFSAPQWLLQNQFHKPGSARLLALRREHDLRNG
jgi:hypothetical protein